MKEYINSEKRILMISQIATHPHNAGNRHRIYEEVCALKRLGYVVDYLFFGNCDASIEKMKCFFGDKHFFYVRMPPLSLKFLLKRDIRSYLDKHNISKKFALKYSLDEWYREEIGQKALRLHEKYKYTAIWVQYIFYSKVLELFPNEIIKIIDTHDRFSDRHKIYQRNGMVPNYYYTSKRNERKALRRADCILAIQDQEQVFFSRLLRGNTTKVYTLGDMLSLKENEIIHSNAIGFIGSHNILNVTGINWFIQEVMPLLKKRNTEYKILLAGDICKMIEDSSDYIKLGCLEDVDEFYKQVRICINPVQAGTGLNIKTIEALSHMKPLVTTSVGAKGIFAEDMVFLQADDAEKFADHIIRLIQDSDLCEELSDNCRKYILNYNRKNMETLDKILKI